MNANSGFVNDPRKCYKNLYYYAKYFTSKENFEFFFLAKAGEHANAHLMSNDDWPPLSIDVCNTRGASNLRPLNLTLVKITL